MRLIPGTAVRADIDYATAISGMESPGFSIEESASYRGIEVGASEFSFRLPTIADLDKNTENFSIGVKSANTSGSAAAEKSVNVNILPLPALSVTSISSSNSNVPSGDSTVITVTLNRAVVSSSEGVNMRLIPGTAVRADIDYATAISGMENPGFSIEESASYLGIEVGASEFSFRLPTIADLDQNTENFSIGVKSAQTAEKSVNVNILPKVPAVVTSVSANPNTVLAGSRTRITVSLDKPAESSDPISLKFVAQGASIGDLDGSGISNLTGAYGSIPNLANGGQVLMNAGSSSFAFDIKTAQDSDTVSQDFLIRAKEGGSSTGGPFVNITIKANPPPVPPAVVTKVTASQTTITEGQSTTVTVQLNKPADNNQPIFVRFDGKGSANINDLSRPDMVNLSGATHAVADLNAGGAVWMQSGVSYFSFDIVTADDADVNNETFTIRAKEGTVDDTSAKYTTVTIVPIPIDPTIEFLAVPTEVGGNFKPGAPPINLPYKVVVHNLTKSTSKSKAALLSGNRNEVASYLKQRTLRGFSVIARVELPNYANASGSYCAFTNDTTNALVPLPLSIFHTGTNALNCADKTLITLGDPTGAAWTHTGTDHFTQFNLEFTMDDAVSQIDSTGSHWVGRATAKGQLHLELRANP
jgi:hypothetical protein